MAPTEVSHEAFCLDLSLKIKSLAYPLFQHLELESFVYSRVFSSGKFLYISTISEWTKEFYVCGLYNDKEFQNNHYHLSNFEKNGSFLYINNPRVNSFESALYDFGIWNCLTLFTKHEDSTECWTFCSTPKKNKVINLYLNNVEIFKRFLMYFKIEFSKMEEYQNISRYQTLIFYYPHSNATNERKQSDSTLLEIDRYHLTTQPNDVYLTQKEAECLFFLSQGNKIKEIAMNLSLSPRTVEFYINRVKEKTKLKSKSSLIQLFAEEGLNKVIHFSLKRKNYKIIHKSS